MGDHYPIPAIALDDRLGWIGTSGSGKTYNAGSGVERILSSGGRVVIVDPLDVWWGLRLAADGKKPGHPVVIFGGAHADLPLAEHHGALIGETVATMRESCIVSLGGLSTKASERRFMLAFLDAIYRNADPTKADPFHIVFDEADLWAPQKSSEPMLQSRMEEIVRRGRIKGFIPWLITQRPAVLSKDVLSQVDGLVAFKLTSSQDRDAIGGWIEGQADKAQGREILASLPTMQQGQGVVWVPGRGILETVAFPPKLTFDSSRTPRRGEKRLAGGDLLPIDLGALKERLSAVETEAKANSTYGLRAEIARLKRELAAALRVKPAPPPSPAQSATPAEELAAARAEGERAGLARAQAALAALAPSRSSAVPASVKTKAPAVERKAPAAGITGPQQRVLDALAWWSAFGIDAPTNEQVGFVAAYAPGSGNFNNLKGGMRSIGLIDYPAPGRITLSPSGEAVASKPTVAPSQESFHAAVRAKLTGPQVRLLNPVLAAYPASLGTDEVAAEAGYASGSGNFNNLRGGLRTIGLIDYPTSGQVRAADWLFPDTPLRGREGE